jgi:peptide/nickel transport system substrate-binding protein
MSDLIEKYKDGFVDSYHFGKLSRRAVLKHAAAAGISASTLSILAGSGGLSPAAVAAAPSYLQADSAGLVTVSDEQQATWTRQFNPLITGSRTFTTQGIYESLAVFNTINGELVPWLATDWAWSEDNLTLTVNLREGVLWSDGEAFDADDVVFTFQSFIDNAGLSNGGGVIVAPLLASVSAGAAASASPASDASPVAAGGHTVTFVFKEVNTVALFDILGQVIVPQHVFSTVDDLVTFTNENPVGTGPFANVGRFEAQIWELHKNENYWQVEKVGINGLRFPAFADNDAAQLAMLNGDVDWAGNFVPDIENVYVAKDPENFNYWFPSTGATVHLFLNTTIAPFDNVDVRKAISQAINRDQIVSIAMYDYTHPADTTGLSDAFPAWKNDSIGQAGWTTFDVDAANAALDAAGLAKDGDVRKTADGTAMEYELNVVTGWSDWVQSCDIIAQNLGEVGIKVTVRPYDFSAWLTNVNNGDFTMSIGWTSGGATPYNFYRGLMSSATWNEIGVTSAENWHRFKLEAADEALAAFAATSDQAEQVELMNTLQQLYSDNAPAVPLFPGPQWGEFSTRNFDGFPNEENPYTILSPYAAERGIVLTTLTTK